MRNTLDYFLDAGGNLWKGPSAMDDNLHYARLEGIDQDGLTVWVLRQSEPDKEWREIDVIRAAILVDEYRRQEAIKAGNVGC